MKAANTDAKKSINKHKRTLEPEPNYKNFQLKSYTRKEKGNEKENLSLVALFCNWTKQDKREIPKAKFYEG